MLAVAGEGQKTGPDALDAFYKEVKGKGVTMTALLAKAVGVVLARHPQVNAATREDGMAYPTEVNVAVAVAMPALVWLGDRFTPRREGYR